MKRNPISSLLLTLSLAIVGCGGGGGGHSRPSTGGSGGDVPSDVRQAAIQATEAKYGELEAQGLQDDAWDHAMEAAMKANPAYVDVTVDAESHTVSGMFADGRIHMVVHNYVPDRSAVVPTVGASTREAHLPQSVQARVFHSFGENFPGQAPVEDVSGWLRSSGYNVVPGTPGDASLEVLRGVHGDGFFYINTHGARCEFANSKAKLFCIQSSTVSSPQRDAQPAIAEDLSEGRLTYMTAANGNVDEQGNAVRDTRYAITPAFVAKYWSFAPNSVVWLNACSSADTRNALGAQRFVDALHKKGAGVVFAWSRILGADTAFHSIRYFADRLLGANAFEPESSPQRPFDWKLVYDDMKRKGYTLDNSTGAELTAFPNPGGKTPQILAPTIERMLVDERQGRLILLGGFGDVPGSATIGGANADIASWTADRVELVLKPTGPGSFGTVQVKVDERPSNVRNLTQWTMAIPYTYVKEGIPNLKVSGPVNLRFRGDIGPYREKPGETPVTHTLWAIPTEDSAAPLKASGTYSNGNSTTTWTGSRTFRSDGEGDTVLLIRLKVDPKSHTGALGLAFGMSDQEDGFTETVTHEGGGFSNQFAISFGLLDGPRPFEDPVEGGGVPTIPVPAVDLVFDTDWSIRTKTVKDPLGARFTIPATPAEAAPNPGHPRLAPR